VSPHRWCGGLAAACLLLASAWTPAQAAARADSPYAIHSMLYSNAPFSFKEAMFREAAAMGASSIRVDVAVSAIVSSDGVRDWTSLDEYLELARRYRLQVVAVLLGTPWWLADCPKGVAPLDFYKCRVSDPSTYARLAGEIAAHARGVIDDWEIRNEPDGKWAYLGSERDYAREFTATAAAIHAANPRSRVLLGGVMTLDSRDWLLDVFAEGGTPLRRSIDVANVHVRGPLASLGRVLRCWRRFFAREHVRAPVWVTEHGYPSDPEYQTDRSFVGGERGQAAYLSRSIPALLDAGAARVFVTERDNLGGSFASEGLLGGTVADPPVADPVVRRKPSAAAFALLTRKGADDGRSR
jgi:hypothetical protein